MSDWRDRKYYPPGWEADLNKMFLHYDDISVAADAMVCPGCQGKGMCVNPNIDRGGLSREDMEPEEMDMYMRGVYDIVCPWCEGVRIVLQPQEDSENGKVFFEDQREMYDSDAERDSERRMGA